MIYDVNIIGLGFTFAIYLIIVLAPSQHTGGEYHTNEGIIVPSISLELKNELIQVSGLWKILKLQFCVSLIYSSCYNV